MSAQPVDRRWRVKEDAYACAACRRRYPIQLGIPDFRLGSDPWLSIEDDRAKGQTLDAQTRNSTLRETVEAYWAMTPTTSPERARRFTEHVLGAEARSRAWLAALGLDRPARSALWIDLGCGTADLAVAAASHTAEVVAVDIAFRWLVVARKRLQEARIDNVTLVCADAAAMPFADAVAERVLSQGLLEHSGRMADVIKEAGRVLASRGELQLRTRSTATQSCRSLMSPSGVSGSCRHDGPTATSAVSAARDTRTCIRRRQAHCAGPWPTRVWRARGWRPRQRCRLIWRGSGRDPG